MAYTIDLLLRGAQRTKAGLGKVAQGVRQIGREQRKVDQVQEQSQKRLSDRVREREQRERQRARSRRTGRIGQGFALGGKIGGTGGTILSGIGESLSAGRENRGLAALGLAAVGVGIALNAFNAQLQRAEESVRRRVQIEQELTSSIRDASQNSQQAALALADAERRNLLRLAGAGGGAVERGRQIAREFGAGSLGAAASLSDQGLLTDQVIEAMRMAVASGRLSPDEFARTLGENRGLLRGRSAQELAGAVVSKGTGRSVDLEAELGRIRGSDIGERLSAIRDLQGERVSLLLDRVFSGGAGVAAGRELAQVATPEALAMQELARENQRQVEVLSAIHDDTSLFVSSLRDLASIIGMGEGSAARRLEREQSAFNAALDNFQAGGVR